MSIKIILSQIRGEKGFMQGTKAVKNTHSCIRKKIYTSSFVLQHSPFHQKAYSFDSCKHAQSANVAIFHFQAGAKLITVRYRLHMSRDLLLTHSISWVITQNNGVENQLFSLCRHGLLAAVHPIWWLHSPPCSLNRLTKPTTSLVFWILIKFDLILGKCKVF